MGGKGEGIAALCGAVAGWAPSTVAAALAPLPGLAPLAAPDLTLVDFDFDGLMTAATGRATHRTPPRDARLPPDPSFPGRRDAQAAGHRAAAGRSASILRRRPGG